MEREARGDRSSDRPARFEGHVRPPQPSAERLTRVEADTFDLPPANGLIPLPEIPRRPSERFPEATGPQAEAAAKGMELLLRIAGLSLSPRILQGEERLEVDHSGEDVDWCFADDGEFVVSVEHLLPRLIRSLSGEAPLVRVDCDNFQEIREERLRSLAQRVAEEVRRKGRPRMLEPMNPADRRIIHMTLADDPGVVSESAGDGYFKRVTIKPA
jgi:spoIIIJ-associated protein